MNVLETPPCSAHEASAAAVSVWLVVRPLCRELGASDEAKGICLIDDDGDGRWIIIDVGRRLFLFFLLWTLQILDLGRSVGGLIFPLNRIYYTKSNDDWPLFWRKWVPGTKNPSELSYTSCRGEGIGMVFGSHRPRVGSIQSYVRVLWTEWGWAAPIDCSAARNARKRHYCGPWKYETEVQRGNTKEGD